MGWIRHFAAAMRVRRRFPQGTLDAIHKAIAAAERRHCGEICFAIENTMPWRHLARGRSPRERAQEVFAQLRVWDTEHNSGVLIYVLLAERTIEIVADRGIAARVPQADWQAVCERMRARFAAGDYQSGAVEGVNSVGDILARHFPAEGTAQENELSDAPVVL